MNETKVLTRDEYYAQHILCPKCKTKETVFVSNIYLMRSEARDYADKLNTARCDCGWRGMLYELLKPSDN